MEDEEEQATLVGQFKVFAKFMDVDRNGTTIDLYRSDYWLRQSKVLDDRNLTMTDTGLVWIQFSKTELTFGEWYEFLTEICYIKDMDQVAVEGNLTGCGLPGFVHVTVPQYRDFFNTYKPPNKLLN